MKMEILNMRGRKEISLLYLSKLPARSDCVVEFAEALSPPHPIDEKWVLIVSTALGCPIKCRMCDAGMFFGGLLTSEEILAQIDYLVMNRFGAREVPVKKFKIQFARMGEPSFNQDLLEVLPKLRFLYRSPGLMPCISTVAPANSFEFLLELISIKDRYYRDGRFQIQFSIHTTDEARRNFLIPCRKLGFEEIAEFGKRYWKAGDRKITLNFAAVEGFPIDESVLLQHFDPSLFLIKMTPLNPTASMKKNGLESLLRFDCPQRQSPIENKLREAGYDVIVSFGEEEENRIGTNCGQLVSNLTAQTS